MSGYTYHHNNFVFKYKSYFAEDICTICFSEGELEFMKTNCGHKVCISCFKEIYK